jgi:hypothetical protein
MSLEEDMKEEIGKEVTQHTAKNVGKVVGVVAAIVGGFFFAIFLGFLLGWVIQWLWNNTLVAMFDLPPISYWQAVGVFILAKIFFGFGHSGTKTQHESVKAEEKEAKDAERVRRWWRSRMGMETPDESTFKKYWDAEGKAAYAAYLAARSSDSSQ